MHGPLENSALHSNVYDSDQTVFSCEHFDHTAERPSSMLSSLRITISPTARFGEGLCHFAYFLRLAR